MTTPTAADPSAIRALRDDLTAARYTVDALTALWGAEAGAALERGNRVPARRALAAQPGPRATLAALLLLGERVPRAELDAALPSLGAAGAAALGIATVDGERALPAVDLRPYSFTDSRGTGEWWLASDLGELTVGGALPVDHVLGVGGASMTLAALQLPGDVGDALDLGTGCGIQALHLARAARRVVATDISARALRFAAFNAALNDVGGIEFRQGSLFEPVAGERFERIVTNPPFVITPRREGVPEYEYRDGGRVGDALVAEVVRGSADHLVPGGIAQLLGNWEERADAAGLDRALGWATEGGLEAWIVERDRLDPAHYAETWIRDGGTRVDTPQGEELVGAWLDDFAARGVTGVGVGYLLLRRPAYAPRLRRTERLDGPAPEGGLGIHLAAVLAEHDRLAALDDAALAEARFLVAPDVTEERSHWPGQGDPSAIVLRQGGGFGRAIRVDPALAAIVGACDGDLPLGVITDAVAQLLEADPAALREAALAEVRELVLAGILRVAPPSPVLE